MDKLAGLQPRHAGRAAGRSRCAPRRWRSHREGSEEQGAGRDRRGRGKGPAAAVNAVRSPGRLHRDRGPAAPWAQMPELRPREGAPRRGLWRGREQRAVRARTRPSGDSSRPARWAGRGGGDAARTTSPCGREQTCRRARSARRQGTEAASAARATVHRHGNRLGPHDVPAGQRHRPFRCLLGLDPAGRQQPRRGDGQVAAQPGGLPGEAHRTA